MYKYSPDKDEYGFPHWEGKSPKILTIILVMALLAAVAVYLKNL